MLKFLEFILEKELTLDELGKIRNDEIRGNVLVKKLKVSPDGVKNTIW